MPRFLSALALLFISGRAAPGGEALHAGAKARLGTLQLRHGGAIHALDIAPKGSAVASAGQDGAVRIWSVRTGETLAVCALFRGPVEALKFSPDGKHLAAACPQGGLLVFDPASGKVRWDSGKSGASRCVAWSADGKLLASFSPAGGIL